MYLHHSISLDTWLLVNKSALDTKRERERERESGNFYSVKICLFSSWIIIMRWKLSHIWLLVFPGKNNCTFLRFPCKSRIINFPTDIGKREKERETKFEPDYNLLKQILFHERTTYWSSLLNHFHLLFLPSLFPFYSDATFSPVEGIYFTTTRY